MKKRKRIQLAVLILVLVVAGVLTACNGKKETEDTVVKVGVVGESNEMWDPVIEAMKEEGITVELISFSDYATPNRALAGGEVDLNAFQHYAYFNSEIEDNGYKLASLGDTYISATNIYSKKVSDVSEIKEGSKIAVSNDVTNEGRALKVLEAAGLIAVDEAAGDSPEVTDIVDNPLNLELVEVDAANVYALLPDVAAAVINCDYALDNGLNPKEDAIFQDDVSYYEGKNFVNLIAVREEDKDNEVYQKIRKAYQSEAVEEIYDDVFQGAYKPGWK